jgi:LmbE family N-acetylglucosaminyl deacetylase
MKKKLAQVMVVTPHPDDAEYGVAGTVVRWVRGTEDVNYRSNITETFDVKLSVLQCHKSQVGHIPLQELEGRLRERHSSLAQGEEYTLAEGFHRVEILW